MTGKTGENTEGELNSQKVDAKWKRREETNLKSRLLLFGQLTIYLWLPRSLSTGGRLRQRPTQATAAATYCNHGK